MTRKLPSEWWKARPAAWALTSLPLHSMPSKRFVEAAKKVDSKASYSLDAAVGLLKELPHAKFDETVEISAGLNIDPKKTDQVVRGTVILPHGTGKVRKVIVFCKGEKELLRSEEHTSELQS